MLGEHDIEVSLTKLASSHAGERAEALYALYELARNDPSIIEKIQKVAIGNEKIPFELLLFFTRDFKNQALVHHFLSNFHHANDYGRNSIIDALFSTTRSPETVEKYIQTYLKGLSKDDMAAGMPASPPMFTLISQFGTMEHFWKLLNNFDWNDPLSYKYLYPSLGILWTRYQLPEAVKRNARGMIVDNFKSINLRENFSEIIKSIPLFNDMHIIDALVKTDVVKQSRASKTGVLVSLLGSLVKCDRLQDRNGDVAAFIRDLIQDDSFPADVVRLAVNSLDSIRHPDNVPFLVSLFARRGSVMSAGNDIIRVIGSYKDDRSKQFLSGLISGNLPVPMLKEVILALGNQDLDPVLEGRLFNFLFYPDMAVVANTCSILHGIDPRITSKSWHYVYASIAPSHFPAFEKNLIPFWYSSEKQGGDVERVHLTILDMLETYSGIVECHEFLIEQFSKTRSDLLLWKMLPMLVRLNYPMLKDMLLDFVRKNPLYDKTFLQLAIDEVYKYYTRFSDLRQKISVVLGNYRRLINQKLDEYQIKAVLAQFKTDLDVFRRAWKSTLIAPFPEPTDVPLSQSGLPEEEPSDYEFREAARDMNRVPLSWHRTKNAYEYLINWPQSQLAERAAQPTAKRSTIKSTVERMERRVSSNRTSKTINSPQDQITNLEEDDGEELPALGKANPKYMRAVAKVAEYLNQLYNLFDCDADLKEMLGHETKDEKTYYKHPGPVRELGYSLLCKIGYIDEYWGRQVNFDLLRGPTRELEPRLNQYMAILRESLQKVKDEIENEVKVTKKPVVLMNAPLARQDEIENLLKTASKFFINRQVDSWYLDVLQYLEGKQLQFAKAELAYFRGKKPGQEPRYQGIKKFSLD